MSSGEPATSAGGTHAIVTGGSSGIGLATARLLAARGARLTLIARTRSRLDEAVGELRGLGAQALAVPADVADQRALESGIARAVREFGPCDILITSAGMAHPGYFTELPDEIFRQTMEVDYFGTLWSVRAVVPSMIERGTGAIVGVSSAAGLYGVFGYTPYSPAKFAVRGLFEALRSELRPYGIHVGCVYPPDVDTPQLAYENQFKPPETAAINGTMRALSPEAVARTILAGIDRRRPDIFPHAQARLLATAAGLWPGLVRSIVDRAVTRVRRDHPSPQPQPPGTNNTNPTPNQ